MSSAYLRGQRVSLLYIYYSLPPHLPVRNQAYADKPWQKLGRVTKAWEESAKLASRQLAVSRQGGVRKETYQARLTALCKSYIENNATAPWYSGASSCSLKEGLRDVISKFAHELREPKIRERRGLGQPPRRWRLRKRTER